MAEIEMNSMPGSNSAAELRWKNICCDVGKRRLLNNISGSVQGKLMAILGPSGAGKTTFLNTLALRNHSGTITGDISLNGVKMSKNVLKDFTGYVMQDDLFFESITVRENLMFSANLRLPASMTKEERLEHVERTITMLGLRKCADTCVGGHGQRGISGGERKRLSVGVELLSNPRLLFLDEPTSGLDSSTACSIISVLKKNINNCTAICTIHQPSTKIFELFDMMMILSAGNVVFFGNSQDAAAYYTFNDFACPPFSNPADHFLDVISADPADTKALAVAVDNAQKLITCHSNQQQETAEEGSSNSFDHLPMDPVTKPGFLTQFWNLYMRSATNYFRDRRFIFTQTVQNMTLAILIGLVFLDLPFDQTGITRRFSSAFFIAINQGVFAVYAVITGFPLERSIILRERSAGTYRTLPYFLAKSLAELPMQVLFPSMFTLVVYFMIGYRHDFYAYANFWILVELGNFTAISLGFAISAASPTVAFSTVLTPLIMEVWRLFGGFFSQPTPLPDWLLWIQYISFVTYVFTGLAKNEIMPLQFHCLPTQTPGGVCAITTGAAAVQRFNLVDVEIYQCQLILIGMILFYRVFAYVFVLKNKP